MGLIGQGASSFDISKISSTLNTISSSYNSLHDAIRNHIQKNFINNGMSQYWACNEAQKFFTDGVKPQVDELIRVINANFNAVIVAIDAAAKAWATATGTPYTNYSFTLQYTTIDVTAIQENINGIRGIDKVQAIEVTKYLDSFGTDANTALSQSVTAVKSSGFIGGTQETNLIAALTKNETLINNFVAQMKSSIQTAIQNTVNNYGDTEGRIASAFNTNYGE